MLTIRLLAPLVSFAGLAALAVSFGSTMSEPPAKVDFNRDIRAILAKCLDCHGPGLGEGIAGLRLDSYASATKKLPSGRRAIVPGQPTESELIRRVTSKDDDYRMPPPETHKTVSPAEVELLREWIRQGAEFKEHWAFEAPAEPTIPKTKNTVWPRGNIDRFILATLEAHNLPPSPEADRNTLIRRLSLDITGLPPTPNEVNAFLGDKSARAYENLVDRLLSSPRYGERMAMDWMDYARYADSNGYQADYERYQWRWRDWVIDAFNKNMPYDQFTIEQLAGDMLPNATSDQRLATAFNRNHRINTEGGVIAEEWRVENVIDRVETTAEVWLGITAGCARCHDHKYDPISMGEFYQLFAYFNNVPETGTGEERPVNHPPLMKAPYPAQQRQMEQLQRRLSELNASAASLIKANIENASTWKLENAGAGEAVTNGLEAAYKLSDKPLRTYGTGDKPTVAGTVASDPGKSSGGVVTSDAGHIILGSVGDVERSESFSYGAWIWPEEGNGAALARMDTNDDFRGWDLFFDGGTPIVHLIHKWPVNTVKIVGRTKIPLKEWSHLFVTYDGSSKATGLRIYINGKPIEADVHVDALSGTIKTSVPTTIGRRTVTNIFKGKVDDFLFYRRMVPPAEVSNIMNANGAQRILTIPKSERTHAQKEELARLWLVNNNPNFRRIQEEILTTDAKRAKLDSEISTVMIMEEMKTPRDAYILLRGHYEARGDRVTAGIPKFLPPLPKGAPNNRLGFAKWVVSKDNPLTARVTVNRLWERFFGTGIVETSEDFGTRASYPSHPELLDYLGNRFVRLRWDLKAMIKEIVMSATYRQSSAVTPDRLAADPQNRLLSRGPRFRLSAETIRDQALFVSGLLVEKLGGPSVRPYQPEGVWDETNVYGNLRNYKHDTGEGLYRRSLYTIWKRTAAPPNMTLFDAPSRELCRVKRSRTNTPLQALTLLNETTYIEAARVAAERVLSEGGVSRNERIRYAFKLVLSRNPTSAERKLISDGLQRRLDYYRRDFTAAQKLVRVGEAPVPAGTDIPVLAAYTVMMNTLLNLDETVTKE